MVAFEKDIAQALKLPLSRVRVFKAEAAPGGRAMVEFSFVVFDDNNIPTEDADLSRMIACKDKRLFAGMPCILLYLNGFLFTAPPPPSGQ